MQKSNSKKGILVSAIIPVKNGEKYIDRAISSALLQESEDLAVEIIVIDDGSTDETISLVQSYERDYPSKVHLLINDSNQGVAYSRNAGVLAAKGSYIAFLDADDWWAEGKLLDQVRLLEEKGAVICGTGRELVSAEGQSLGKYIGVAERISFQELLRTNSLSCSSVVLRREVALEFPMEHDELHEDYYTWLRILKKYEYAYGISKPYLKSRMSEGGKSRNKLTSAKMHLGVLKLMGYHGLRAWYLFACYAVNGIRKYK